MKVNRFVLFLATVLLALTLALLFRSSNVRGQDASSETPLEIVSTAEAETGEGPIVNVTTVNRSLKGIAVHVIVGDFFDENSSLISRAAHLGLAGRSMPGSESHSPGHSMTMQFHIPTNEGKAARYKIYVDYIRFADGSVWGPDQTHHSMKIDGIIQGWSMAESRFRSLLKSEGVAAVVEELGQ